jgi:hypothetical protein
MNPERRKRIRERHAEWLRTDPLNQRLRESIERHKARAEAQKRAQENRDRESS